MLGDHDDSLDGEPAVAVVEKILKTRTKQVNHKDVVQSFLTKVVDVGDASYQKLVIQFLSCYGCAKTYGIRPRSCKSDTHLAAEEHRFSGVQT